MQRPEISWVEPSQHSAPRCEFARQVMAALGIESKGVVSLDLHLSGNTAPTVTVRRMVFDGGGAALVNVIAKQRFQLVLSVAPDDNTQQDGLS